MSPLYHRSGAWRQSPTPPRAVESAVLVIIIGRAGVAVQETNCTVENKILTK